MSAPTRDEIRRHVLDVAGNPGGPEALPDKAALERLRRRFGRISEQQLDPVYELFGTGGEGTLSHTIVSDVIAELEEEVGLREKPLAPGEFTKRLKDWLAERNSPFMKLGP